MSIHENLTIFMKSAITKLLKELRFRYHLFIPFSKGEYIPIQWIFDLVDCDDEAIICREFRTNFPEIEISDDGQEWKVQVETSVIDKRTVYVEGSWEDVEPELNLSLVEDLWHNADSTFHFVTFKKETEAIKVIKSSQWKPMHQSSHRSVRWIHKPIWNQRMHQFYNLRTEQVELHEQEKRDKKSSHTLLYSPGLIGCFSNVHDRTDTKTLKNLFEMVSPVSYVDYEQGNTWGYVRFKTRRGAQLAQNYFTRCCVTQRYPADATGSLDPHRSVRHFSFLMRNKDTFSDAMTMYILEGEEEKTYWDQIFAAQHAREGTIVESAPPTHIKFNEDEEELESANSVPSDDGAHLGLQSIESKKGHVRFLSDDEESQTDLIQLPGSGEENTQGIEEIDYPKRKPRHRKRRKLQQV
jgi:hypothetical protein